MLRKLRRRIGPRLWYYRIKGFVTPPKFVGARLTLKRLLNLYLMRYHLWRVDTKLRSYPVRLTIEATNVCNLRCPGCFTGLGEVGRERSFMPLELYERLLNEFGDYLFELEFYNWGEPLLHKQVYTMIEQASGRGISTKVSTNFSLPFDAERAERLVSSGLAVLGVSLDGATQDSYEQYRVRGKIDTVLENCRLVRDAKRKLASASPKVVWEFHAFPHNVDDVERARALARELEMDFGVSKGWVVGPDWEPQGDIVREIGPQLESDRGPRMPCLYLWGTAVVNNDGGAAPCCGSFYRQDDFGKLKMNGEAFAKATFKEIWNNWSYQEARRLFRSRTGSKATKRLICFDCPVTVMFERYRGHLGAGRNPQSFEGGYSFNEGFMYFYERRQLWSRAAAAGSRNGADAIELQPVEAKPSHT